MSDTASRLLVRAGICGVPVPPQLLDRLVTYFDLLFRWNRKINLTALTEPDAAIDRLILEPLAAALVLPPHLDIMDLGSGGGSPAIPLALALESPHLVMVESKSRKAAFLGQAARAVSLNAVVVADRFESLSQQGQYNGQMSLVSIRGVRIEPHTLTVAQAFLKPSGKIALFSTLSVSPPDLPSGLRVVCMAPRPGSHLVVLGK